MSILPYNRSSLHNEYGYVNLRITRSDGLVTNPPQEAGYHYGTFDFQNGNYDNGYYNTHWRDDVKSGRSAGTDRNASRIRSVKLVSGDYTNVYYDDNSGLNKEYNVTGLIVTSPQFQPWVEPPLYSVPSDLVTQALTKFSRKNIDTRRYINGGVIIGELPETLHLLKDVVTSFKRHTLDFITRERLDRVKDLRLSRFRGASSQKRAKSEILGNWLDRYLGYVYGVRPLVADISDAVSVINRAAAPKQLRLGVSSKSKSFVVYPAVGRDGYQGYAFTSNIDVHFHDVVECKVSVQAGLGASSDQLTMPNLGIGLADFLPTVYELIPYSFVADYFSNLGDVIAQLGTRQNILWSSMTKKVKVTRNVTLSGNAVSPGSGFLSHSGFGGSASITRETIQRTANPDLDFGVRFRTPDVGSLKWLNMGVLAGALVHRTL